MTVEEHKQEAERLLEWAKGLNLRNEGARAEAAVLTAQAQVHADLAKLGAGGLTEGRSA